MVATLSIGPLPRKQLPLLRSLRESAAVVAFSGPAITAPSGVAARTARRHELARGMRAPSRYASSSSSAIGAPVRVAARAVG